MKKSRSFNQNTKLKQKQNLTWYIVAAGVAIIIVVGIGIFFYFNLGVNTDASAEDNMGYTSHNNYSGIWNDEATWTIDQPWMGKIPSYTGGSTQYVDIYGFITREGDLTIANGNKVTIYDTLWVQGSLYFQGDYLTIESDGLLVVEENFDTWGGALTVNGGKAVIKGNLNATEGANINNYSDFYLFGSASASGGTQFNGMENTPSNSNFQNIDDLQYNDASTYHFVTGSGGTLPVDFQYVKAEKNGNTVKIMWATATELNNDFFTIEKSQDGKNFQAIGTVKGAGDSNTLLTYQFDDKNLSSTTQFYRVKQTDFDGQFDYSDIVSVSDNSQLKENNSIIDILSVVPNPFEDRITVDFELPVAGSVSISLMNMNGLVVASELLEGYEGGNRYTFEGQHGLGKGIYLLQITQNNITSKVMRVIKK